MIALKSILVWLLLYSNISSLDSYRTLSIEEAEKILGQTAKLAEEHLEEKDGLVTYKSTYQATTNDEKTDKLGSLYYVFEKYPNPEKSQKVFEGIVASNSAMPGQERSNDIGEETWIHTDQANFYLIMFERKIKSCEL